SLPRCAALLNPSRRRRFRRWCACPCPCGSCRRGGIKSPGLGDVAGTFGGDLASLGPGQSSLTGLFGFLRLYFGILLCLLASSNLFHLVIRDHDPLTRQVCPSFNGLNNPPRFQVNRENLTQSALIERQ